MAPHVFVTILSALTLGADMAPNCEIHCEGLLIQLFVSPESSETCGERGVKQCAAVGEKLVSSESNL